jgi:hypothetical protein
MKIGMIRKRLGRLEQAYSAHYSYATVIILAVGSAHAISKGQLLSSTISLIITDSKGPFKILGLEGEIYAQSFFKVDTKFLWRYNFFYRSSALSNLKK